MKKNQQLEERRKMIPVWIKRKVNIALSTRNFCADFKHIRIWSAVSLRIYDLGIYFESNPPFTWYNSFYDITIGLPFFRCVISILRDGKSSWEERRTKKIDKNIVEPWDLRK